MKCKDGGGQFLEFQLLTGCMACVGVGWGYEISCVLSRKGDVGAWVLLCRPKFV